MDIKHDTHRVGMSFCQIELMINFKGRRDSFSVPIQVIGNVENDHHLT